MEQSQPHIKTMSFFKTKRFRLIIEFLVVILFFQFFLLGRLGIFRRIDFINQSKLITFFGVGIMFLMVLYSLFLKIYKKIKMNEFLLYLFIFLSVVGIILYSISVSLSHGINAGVHP